MDKLPQTSFIDAKIALTDIYETTTGIWDHLTDSHKKKSRPLASVALHDCESTTEGSDLYTVISKYIDDEVYKETGLDLNEFLNLPSDIVQMLFKKIQDRRFKKDKEQSELLAGINTKEKTKP